jgi:hypothetical protein
MDKLFIDAYNPPVNVIRNWLLDAGNKIGSVWFFKKSTGELRKMSYRLHTRKPSVAKTPSNKSGNRRAIDNKYNNMTVLDCNSVVRDEKGNKIGRGSWKSIPLDNITRIKSNGREILIHKTYSV